MSTADQAGTSVRSASGSSTEATRPLSRPQTDAGSSNGAADPAPSTASATASRGTGRRVRLTVSRVDPWSAMKMSFLLSVALGIAGVVMVSVLWMILAGMGVFTQVNDLVGQIIQDGNQTFDIMDFLGFGRVVSLAIVVGVIDVILMTALATLAAFLYNVSSSLVGGLQLTLTDD